MSNDTAPSWGDWLQNVKLHEDKHTDDGGQPRPLEIQDVAQCGTCLRKWCETCNPTPSARCPFEYDHDKHDDDEPAESWTWPTTDAEHESYRDWQYDVANGDTLKGFREWLGTA